MVQSSLARLVQAAIPISKSLTGAANVLRGDKKVVELTDAAASHVRQLLTNGGREYLKLSVKKLGKRDMVHEISFCSEKGRFDELMEDKGVRILIDPSALMHVAGLKLDYRRFKNKPELVYIKKKPRVM